MSNSVGPYGLQPARLFCSWDSPGKNTGVQCCALFQQIFLTQGLNPWFLCLLHWQGEFFITSTTGKLDITKDINIIVVLFLDKCFL